MGVFQSPRLSVGSMKSVTFPSNGPFTYASLTTIAPLVAGNLILAVGMIFNLGVTSYALGLLVRIVFFQCCQLIRLS